MILSRLHIDSVVNRFPISIRLTCYCCQYRDHYGCTCTCSSKSVISLGKSTCSTTSRQPIPRTTTTSTNTSISSNTSHASRISSWSGASTVDKMSTCHVRPQFMAVSPEAVTSIAMGTYGSVKCAHTFFNFLKRNSIQSNKTQRHFSSHFSYWHHNLSLNQDNQNHQVTNVRRSYTSGNDKRDDNRPQVEVKGLIVQLPNPLDWLRIKWYSHNIRHSCDPSFSFDEFLVGAKQAVCYLTRLVALQDFEEMKNVASEKAILRLQDVTSEWSTAQRVGLELRPEHIQLAKPNVTSFNLKDKTYVLDIDVFFLAMKSHDGSPIHVQINLRLQRSYSLEAASGWSIVSVGQLKVSQFGQNRKPEDE